MRRKRSNLIRIRFPFSIMIRPVKKTLSSIKVSKRLSIRTTTTCNHPSTKVSWRGTSSRSQKVLEGYWTKYSSLRHWLETTSTWWIKFLLTNITWIHHIPKALSSHRNRFTTSLKSRMTSCPTAQECYGLNQSLVTWAKLPWLNRDMLTSELPPDITTLSLLPCEQLTEIEISHQSLTLLK